jgi:mono/diheme cytochrome c family protein
VGETLIPLNAAPRISRDVIRRPECAWCLACWQLAGRVAAIITRRISKAKILNWSSLMRNKAQVSWLRFGMVRGAFLWALCVAFFSMVGFAGDKNAQSSASIKRGDLLFHQLCVSCHNKQPGDDYPFGPPNLYDVLRRKEITPSQASDVIRQGRAQMPSFGARITDGQISDLIAYLQAH